MKHYRKTVSALAAAAACSLLSFGATAIAAGNGAALYVQNCAACHGDAGHGDGPAGKYLTPHPADFATSLKGKSDAWIAKAIKGGGPAVGEAAVMPAYKDLSDRDVTDLAAYVKQLAGQK
ncbi:MAG: c-type cytochrome [Candidatus Binataceae bacterium]